MFAVDVPNYYNPEGEWKNVDYFYTKEEAIEYCKKVFGADDDGKISLITDIGEEEEGGE